METDEKKDDPKTPENYKRAVKLVSFHSTCTSIISLYVHQYHYTLRAPVSFHSSCTSIISLYVHQYHFTLCAPVSFHSTCTSIITLYVH
ncbi:hypothetical protein BgiBS90_032761 [Biomphalaria glabrata]|nr:hypothetical protein BgiBS90_032761 [Biomphalaria glabrata]